MNGIVLMHFHVSVLCFLTSSQSSKTRTIWHYQYLSWPDHGVPQEPGGVLSFLTQVNSKQAEYPDAGPMIIHCRYQTAFLANRLLGPDGREQETQRQTQIV